WSAGETWITTGAARRKAATRRRRAASRFLLLGNVTHDFINGQETVVVAVDFAEFLQRPAADFPFVEADLPVAIAVDLLEPIGNVLGQVAGVVNNGFLDLLVLGGHGRAAEVRHAALPVRIPASVFRHALLNDCLEIRFEFAQINEAVLVGVPLVSLGPK